MRAPRSSLALSIMLAAGCGAEAPRPDLGPAPPPPTLIVVNKWDKELEAVHVHSAPADYGKSANRVARPLKRDEGVTVAGLAAGRWYVTVVRLKGMVEVGERIAITTGEALDLRRGIYTLWVFEQSFRLWDPRDAGTPRADVGARRDSGGRDRGPFDAVAE
jgi:hypothetical protein